jgi:hypothetical protein
MAELLARRPAAAAAVGCACGAAAHRADTHDDGAPLPPFALDLLFTFNIASMLVLLVAYNCSSRWISRCFQRYCSDYLAVCR